MHFLDLQMDISSPKMITTQLFCGTNVSVMYYMQVDE